MHVMASAMLSVILRGLAENVHSELNRCFLDTARVQCGRKEFVCLLQTHVVEINNVLEAGYICALDCESYAGIRRPGVAESYCIRFLACAQDRI